MAIASVAFDELMNLRYATSPSVDRTPTMTTTVRSSTSVKARLGLRCLIVRVMYVSNFPEVHLERRDHAIVSPTLRPTSVKIASSYRDDMTIVGAMSYLN